MGREIVAKTTKKKTTTKKATASKSKSKKTGSSAKSTAKKPVAKKATKKKTSTRKKAVGEEIVNVDRRNLKREDRRDEALEEILNQELESPPVERREKVNRRRQIDPTTCERDYNNGEIEFMHALDDYKRKAGRMFPTCSEILEVVRDLGYHRLSPEQLATLGLGQQDSAEGEQNTDDPDAASPDAANPNGPADSNEFGEAFGEVAAAGELSDSIRSGSEPVAEPIASESF